MPTFSPEAMARMRALAQQQGRGSSGGGKWVALTGQNAIVAPGGDVIVRLMPRWDFFDQRYAIEKKKCDGCNGTGKAAGKACAKCNGAGTVSRLVERQDYKAQEPFIHAFEHWWSPQPAKRQRDWCLKTAGPEYRCPLCEAAAAYKAGATEQEQALGHDMLAKEVFIYNVVVRSRQYGEDGRPAIRILPVPWTLWMSIMRSAGGMKEGEEEFSIGDYTDWREGYDWKIHRPAARKAGQKQDEYTAEHAKAGSMLYKPEEKDRWKGWHLLLHDLEKEITLKPYAALYEEVFRVAPDEGDTGMEEGSAPPTGGDGGDGGGEFASGGDEGAFETGTPPEASGDAAAPAETPAPSDTDFEYPSEPATPSRPTPRTAAPAAAAPRAAAPPMRPGPARRR